MERRSLLLGGVAAATSLILPKALIAAGKESPARAWEQGGGNPFEGGPHEGVSFLSEEFNFGLSPRESDYAHEAVDRWFEPVGFDPDHPMIDTLEDGDEWTTMVFGRRNARKRYQNVIVRESKWSAGLPREYFLIRMVDPYSERILEIGIPKVCGNPCARRLKKGQVYCIPLPAAQKAAAQPIPH